MNYLKAYPGSIALALLIVCLASSCTRDTSFSSARTQPPLEYNSSAISEIIDFELGERQFSIDDYDSWRRPRPQPSVISDSVNLGDAGFSAPNLVALLQTDSSGVWTLVLAERGFDRSARLLNAIDATGAELLDPNLQADYIDLAVNSQPQRLQIDRRSNFWYLRLPDAEPAIAQDYLNSLQEQYLALATEPASQ